MAPFRSNNPVLYHEFNKYDKALTMKMALTNKRNFIRGITWVSAIFLFIIGISLFMVLNIEPTDPIYLERAQEPTGVYIAVVVFLLLIYFLIIFLAFKVNVKPLLKDLKGNTKVIEQVNIKEKKYMPQNNTYHLYVQSVNRVSIEVSEQDYKKFQLGDEVNLEFTPNASIYLGYY